MQRLRGLTVGLNSSGRYKFKPPESVVDHLVIGGGVVGLAVARRLAQRFPDKTTFLIERHTRAGEEISSRNSEVIHAGLYYPPDSLKTKLCLRGRALLYAYCATHNVPVRKTGKLVVARTEQTPYIERLHAKAAALSAPDSDDPVLPTELISGARARELEPDLSHDIAAALWSPETGIVDSHALMASLEADIADSEGGALAFATRAVRVDAAPDGWVVQAVTGADDGEGDALLAHTLVNASGLAGPRVLNALLPPAGRIPTYFARGSYASYRGPGARAAHLIYPCPDTAAAKDRDSHAFQSLGTHLTLDLQGKVRFGPDLEWIQPEADEEGEVDFWRRYLVPDESRLGEMYKAVREYLPGVVLEGMQPDYVGVRPKLVPPGGGFQDFVIRTDYSGDFVAAKKGRGGPMVSLLGIESPGLTASLAIAETVVDDILTSRKDSVQ